MNNQSGRDISWKTCAKLMVSALVVFLAVRYWAGVENFIGLLFSGIAAILTGFVIAYVVNIPMRFYERKLPGETGDGTTNRAISMALAIASIIAVILFVSLLVIPQLVAAVIQLANDAPGVIQSITSNEIIASLIPESILYQLQNIDWGKIVTEAAAWLQSGLATSLPQIASLAGQIGAWFMGIVFAFWYLAEKDRLGAQCHRLVKNYLGASVEDKATRAIDIVDECFHHYIVGQSLEALIFGSLVAVGSFMFGLPYPLMLGALVGVMSLIPMVGALIGAILGAFIILATSWQKAIIFLVVFFVMQQIEANFIYRNVVGKRVALTGMWPLIGVTLGAALFGIGGAFVGVPMMAVAFRIVKADMVRREELPEDAPTLLDKLQSSLSD